MRKLDIVQRFRRKVDVGEELATRLVIVVTRGEEPIDEERLGIYAEQSVAVPPDGALQLRHEAPRKLVERKVGRRKCEDRSPR